MAMPVYASSKSSHKDYKQRKQQLGIVMTILWILIISAVTFSDTATFKALDTLWTLDSISTLVKSTMDTSGHHVSNSLTKVFRHCCHCF
jgi:hypothetical protein